MAGEIYVANTSGFVHVPGKGKDDPGEDIRIEAGVTRVREGHPLYKQAPDLFSPLEVQYDVEQATRAPGEKRA